MKISAALLTMVSLMTMTAGDIFAGTSKSVDTSLQTGLATAKQKTRIPILLPGTLPPRLQSIPGLISSATADNDSYDIPLYMGDGSGGTTLFVGDFSGNAHYKFAPRGKPVRLIDHIVGHFLPRSCGGSCAPSSIEWRVKGIHYEIQLKFGFDNEAEEQKTMVDVANSAISGGAR
ncbi:hypothetical protein ACFFJT_07080 [Dyella flava]|uniref:Uncharacterized protein n=1 Tax=Dyella flava TaxID=1920170 RepID=A0ABS2K824_9GAMM|nr:hypothetical protein [Dyella flava]MBM7127352.1 hypothetical protein [Dyella flava]GLQ50949.1 hypothetical protein GCM10010872_23980 [Dyella flava]